MGILLLLLGCDNGCHRAAKVVLRLRLLFDLDFEPPPILLFSFALLLFALLLFALLLFALLLFAFCLFFSLFTLISEFCSSVISRSVL